tara:strand:- start:42 stop:308 length:267 start_codon:yes stop_codon:yes gene_type:complete
MEVAVRSQLVHIGHFNRNVAEAFEIVSEDSDGYRWTLNRFATIEKEEADRKLAQIKAHLDNGGDLNLDHWSTTEPRYGSEAYCKINGF